MTQFFPFRLAILLALFALAVSACSTSPFPQETPDRRIVAIGDLHGDYGAMQRVLTAAELINEEGAWIGGDAILVQTGDMADRGPDTLKITQQLRKLQSQAPVSGGEVIVLVGNHEALLFREDYHYLHPGEIEAFETASSVALREDYWRANKDELLEQWRARMPDASDEEIKAAWEERTPPGLIELGEAWSPEGEIGKWIVTLPALVIIDDTLFVHAGLSAEYSNATVDDINTAVRAAFIDQAKDRTAIIHDGNGPLWYRGLHREPGEVAHVGLLGPMTIEEEVSRVLEGFDVSRIVVGHTPSTDGISVQQGGKVIRIDTGMSEVYGGVDSFLEFEDGKITMWNDGVVEVITP